MDRMWADLDSLEKQTCPFPGGANIMPLFEAPGSGSCGGAVVEEGEEKEGNADCLVFLLYVCVYVSSLLPALPDIGRQIQIQKP